MLGLQAKVKQVIQNATPAVVAIDNVGSGVVVTPDGIVLTASHVTRKANRLLNVRFANGRVVQGVTLGSNFATDTGAIRLLEGGPYQALKISNSKSAIVGTWCIAMGYPLSFPRGQAASGRLGRVLDRQANLKLVTDCTIMGGDSGGPLLNLDGNVIAINSSVKLSITKNLYIPSERFVENWKHIVRSIDKTGASQLASQSGGQRPKPYLGVSAESDRGFVRVRQVHPASPAYNARLAPEDVIMAIDGQKTGSFQQLLNVLALHQPAQSVIVRINRFGRIIEIPVTLGSSRKK